MLQTLKNLYWLSRSYKWTIVLVIVGALIVQVLGLASPIVLSRLINLLDESPDHAWPQALAWVAVLLGAMIVFLAVDILTDIGVFRIMFGVEGQLSKRAMKHLLTLPLSYHEKENTGSKLKKIQRGAEKTVHLIARWGWGGIPTLLLFLTTVAAMAATHVWIGLAMLVVIPIIIAISVYHHAKATPDRKSRHDGYENASDVFVQAVQNVETVQSYRQELTEGRRLKDIWRDIYQVGYQEFWIHMRSYGWRSVLNSFITTAIILWAYIVTMQGAIDKGQFALLIMLTWRINHNMWFFGEVLDETSFESTSVNRLRELLETSAAITEKPDAIELANVRGSLTFRHVSFRYAPEDKLALDDVSIEIEPGTTVALVGPSGGGKSTLIKLALRGYDPSEGSVELDGHDLRDLTLNFRQHIGYVPQEPQIFDISIAGNIAYGNRRLTRQQIIAAAQAAHVDEFVSDLQDGYDTIVGEKGIRLSGGQKQRLALARAIAAQPTIYLLDEATSHLDAKSEKLVQDAMQRLAKQQTVIIIAHRLSTIRKAKRILVFRGGKIVESGTHQTLEKKENGVYRELLTLQKTGDIIDDVTTAP